MRKHFTHMALAATLFAFGCSMPGGQTGPATFDTPEEAVHAMFKAISTDDTTTMIALVGPEFGDLITGADAVQAKRDRQVVTAAMIERWWLDGEGETRTIIVGNENYPLPIPLVQESGKWRFDAATGKEELLYRRIGRNELAMMDVAQAFVDAQLEYASSGHDGLPKGAYAQRFLSEEGKQNGLFWPTKPGETPSPMGDLAAKAAEQGYTKDDIGQPYQGYRFKILTEQGPNAEGGQRSWLENGVMKGGFAMLAWPAEYGQSGVMTFMIGRDGVLLQKDLGEATATSAEAITAFDPDTSWSTP
jgi:Protein of unknown function (DUF2950)